jgi:arylsulfatase A-like enzyme
MTNPVPAPASRPNILFLIADDHRFQAVRSNGDPVVQTPTLDALAARGVSFQSAYIHGGCSAAVCVPSRAAVNTGVNPFRAQVEGLPGDPLPLHSKVRSGRIRPDLALLGETFRAAGYRTFATGKWHNDRDSFHRSFSDARNVFFGGMCDHTKVPVQDYDPAGRYGRERERVGSTDSSVLFAETAISFLRAQRGDRPFFVYAAFTAPHDPRTPPPEYRELYPPAAMPVPPNFAPQHPFDNGELKIRDELLASFPREPGEVQRHLAEYYGMISHLDHQLGRILGALEETGQAANTIVVYLADHGLAVGQHGLIGKQNLYDHSIRVPLILAGPGLPSGRRPAGLVYSHDVFPTLCELAGIDIPDTVESHSLRLGWTPNAEGRDVVFAAYKGLQRMLRRENWKLIEYTVPGQPLRRQLFDLRADPWEMRNLVLEPAHRQRVADMSTELEEQRAMLGAPPPAEQTDQIPSA